MRATAIAAVAAAVFALGPAGPASGGGPTVAAQAVATGLDYPAAFTFLDDGRIVYGERFTGEIRVLDPVTDSDTLLFKISNVVGEQEDGLLGLAAHPDYPARPFVYAYVTRTTDGVERNHVVRIRTEADVGVKMRSLVSASVGVSHNGGRILFGPDGMLYVFVGDRAFSATAQDTGDLHGKVLRMTPAGTAPPDNPFVDDPGAHPLVWAYGLRNSFGFSFDPLTGDLWETEAGPECNDEVNRIPPGRNLGWGPAHTCATPPEPPINTNQDGPSPVLPKVWFTPVVTPTGIGFCQGCGLAPGQEGHALFGAFNDRRIRDATLSDNRRRIVSLTTAMTHVRSVLSMEVAPDGTLHISDSRGIYELVPV